jgi:hypothetical protein
MRLKEMFPLPDRSSTTAHLPASRPVIATADGDPTGIEKSPAAFVNPNGPVATSTRRSRAGRAANVPPG